MADAYQTPRFGWLHAARRAGAAAVTVHEAISAATPKERLIDNRGRRLVEWDAPGDKRISLDRGAVPREPLNRFLLLAGHELTGRRVRFQGSTTGAWAGEEVTLLPYSSFRDSSGAGTNDATSGAYETIRPGLNVWDFPSIAYRYVSTQILQDGSAAVPKLGEWWWTRMYEASAGLQPNWRRRPLPAASRISLPSGEEYVLERGPVRQRWEAQTARLLEGDDRLLYERMLYQAGVVRDPVIFDPPDGGYETLIHDCDSITDWSAVNNALIALRVINKIQGSGSVFANVTGANGHIRLALSPTIDARGCLLGVSVRPSARDFMGANSGIALQLISNLPNAATYQFGTNLFTADSTYYEMWVDIDETAPVSSTGDGFEPSRLSHIGIVLANVNATDFYVDRVRLIRKSRAPLVGRLGGEATEEQAAPNPLGAGPRYGLPLEITELVG